MSGASLRLPSARWMRRILDRSEDRPVRRPPDIAFALEERPPARQTLALALQQVAIQSIYFLLPGIVGQAFGLSGLDAANFLCLSVAVLGVSALLQALPRGPVGSGYALPAIPSPVFVAAYLLVAESASPGTAAALTAASGLAGLVLAALLRRLHGIMPTEVAGVVVFLIGTSLLPRALSALSQESPAAGPGVVRLLALATLALMILLALSRSRLARFAVLIGGAAGWAAALALGAAPADEAGLLKQAPWFALPRPQPPSLASFDLALAPAFTLALLASFASWSGDMLAFQKAADGAWQRPDPAPIRRGLMAHCLALLAAGLTGAMAPASSSACVGLAIATRTLSRAVVVAGGVLLLLLGCCPRLVAVFVLVPHPVEAAMLGYVSCFMMASGCQLITARMLDARRTFTAGLGLAAGLGVLIAPEPLLRDLPRALASPVTAGTLVAVALNLLTLPLVRRRAAFEIATAGRMQQEVVDRCEALGGAWGARRETMDRVKHCILEIGEILAGRGILRFAVEAQLEEERIAVLLTYRGDPLPEPAARPDLDALLGPLEAQEAFAMWLATRGAASHQQRSAIKGTELRLEFHD